MKEYIETENFLNIACSYQPLLLYILCMLLLPELMQEKESPTTKTSNVGDSNS